MPRLLAASISMRSSARDSLMARQRSQALSGSPLAGDTQLTALARTRAVLVLPVPRGPQNRKACASRPPFTALRSVFVTVSCPTTSDRARGRHFLYRTSAICGFRVSGDFQRLNRTSRRGAGLRGRRARARASRRRLARLRDRNLTDAARRGQAARRAHRARLGAIQPPGAAPAGRI